MVGLAVRVPARQRRRDGRATSPALPATGITPVICGDAHLGNFGFYASPEGELVIDLNDFDEAHPAAGSGTCAGWWPASGWPAGRTAASEEQCETAVLACVRAPTGTRCASWPSEPLLMRSYNRLDVDRLHETATEKSLRDEIERSAKRARHRTSDRALPRFTDELDGRRQIVEEPPLITRRARGGGGGGRRGAGRLPARPSRRTGGGWSAATRWSTSPTRWSGWAASACGPTWCCSRAAVADDVVFLQLKQARRSVLAPYVHGDLGLARPPGPAGGGVPAGPADRQRPAAGLDHGRRPAVLRAAVPQHEGHHPAGRDRRRGAGRLRRHRRAPAGQGARPDQRRLDDRRLRRQVRQARPGPGPVRPGVRRPDRGRPRATGQGRAGRPAAAGTARKTGGGPGTGPRRRRPSGPG